MLQCWSTYCITTMLPLLLCVSCTHRFTYFAWLIFKISLSGWYVLTDNFFYHFLIMTNHGIEHWISHHSFTNIVCRRWNILLIYDIGLLRRTRIKLLVLKINAGFQKCVMLIQLTIKQNQEAFVTNRIIFHLCTYRHVSWWTMYSNYEYS